MESELRRVFLAMVIALGAYLAFRFVYDRLYPPPPPTPTSTRPAQGEPGPGGQPAPPPGGSPAAPTTGSAPSSAPERTYYFTAASDRGPMRLGGGEHDALDVELRPAGATVASIRLCARDEKGRYVFRSGPDVESPYVVLSPVNDGVRDRCSFGTHRIWIEEYGNRGWRLDELVWEVVSSDAQNAVFRTTLGSGAPGEDLLRLTKTYSLRPHKPVIELSLEVDNLADAPLTVWIEQDGPTGIPAEHRQYDMRRLLAAQRAEGQVRLNKGQQHKALQKAAREDQPLRLIEPEAGPFLWTVLANKYFGVYTRPLPGSGGESERFVRDVRGLVAVPESSENLGDLLARMTTEREKLRPETPLRYTFEIYAGPKSAEFLRDADPAYADPQQLHYQIAQSADTRCCAFCTPSWLMDLMVWLLSLIQNVVKNYGVAIIILVIIIRSLLHPLTVYQQTSMFRMQEAMSRIQPKMEQIKEKYANDKVKLNQEMMKVWGEEGVNPLSNFVSFLPLMLQMPILIALWTALNTDIHLRHAPFIIIPPEWIRDLSAPDALLTFDPVRIPIVSWILGEIDSFNVLPIVMGISMWLQQKYMPKPHLKAKLEAAKKQPEKKPKSGMSPEDQLRQQQIMMYMMSILFPLMFYKMPAGLNLYWMATNVFGIFESLLIRRKIERNKQKPRPVSPRPKKPGLLSNFFKRIASQAEELQRKADEISRKDEVPKKDPRKKKKH